MMENVQKGSILVVDDEPQIARVLKTTLSSNGYSVRTASDGDDAIQVLKTWMPDLLITDLRMPNMSGLELCRYVRGKWRIPIIVLSVKGEERAKVEALDAGADDYVTKPFGVEELLARVRVALRRISGEEQIQDPIVQAGDFHIDVAARMVRVMGSDVHLTPKEFDLLIYLARNAGKVLTHRALLKAVWGSNCVEQPEYLRVFVGHLRKKLELEAGKRYILTEPWVGYRFEPAGTTE